MLLMEKYIHFLQPALQASFFRMHTAFRFPLIKFIRLKTTLVWSTDHSQNKQIHSEILAQYSCLPPST